MTGLFIHSKKGWEFFTLNYLKFSVFVAIWKVVKVANPNISDSRLEPKLTESFNEIYSRNFDIPIQAEIRGIVIGWIINMPPNSAKRMLPIANQSRRLAESK